MNVMREVQRRHRELLFLKRAKSSELKNRVVRVVRVERALIEHSERAVKSVNCVVNTLLIDSLLIGLLSPTLTDR